MLPAAKPPIAVRSSGFSRTPCVIAATGIATMRDAIAYIVTNCPAAASDTPRSLLICGKRPAGRASVRMLTKLAVASASRPKTGKRASGACLVVEEAVTMYPLND
jgi:hypothetical protein